MSSLARYFHTVRYLKAEQLVGQLQRRIVTPRFVSAGPVARRTPEGIFETGQPMPAAMTGPDTFDFVGEKGTLAGGWNDAGKSALWLYNLHYFDDLRRAGAEERVAWHRDLIDRWIRENPSVAGAGWSPYPTSLRIVNWIAWDLACGELDDTARESLADQAGWLAANLETHILGNHLFANLKALAFAGCYFAGDAADRWLGTALDRLERELREQVLADGGNFELSPMYHAIFLADVLDLVALDRVFPGRLPAALVALLGETAERMLGWLRVMTHPDGDPAQFNDCAFGIAPKLTDLAGRAQRLGIAPKYVGTTIENAGVRAVYLTESGYVRFDTDRATAFCDVAQVGPSYLPGHAHADTLSYELSVDGRRIVVNGGTSCYGSGAQRVRERGTGSHSTVVVAGRDSSEVWGGFRVARRAHPIDVSLMRTEKGLELRAAHDGYRRLTGKPVHRRSWVVDKDGLTVADRVSGSLPAAARHVLHPDVSSTLPDRLSCEVTKGVATRSAAFHAPRFGASLETVAVEVALVDGEAALRWCWR